MQFNKNQTQAITGEFAKEVDRMAIEEYGIDSLFLMENASRLVADFIISKFLPHHKICILSGVGNNGADGICVGRMLIDAGFQPKLIIIGKIEKGSYEFFQQLSDYKRRSGKLEFYREDSVTFSSYEKIDLLVDAVFGIGLKSPVKSPYRETLESANKLSCYKIAVDIPSGIHSDTGLLMGQGIAVDITITFGRNKTGLLQNDGINYAGEVRIGDIGIPEELYDKNVF